MHNFYITLNGFVREVNDFMDGCWIKLTKPTPQECTDTAEKFGIELADLRAALDEDEASRVVQEEGYTLVLVDIPVQEVVNVALSYTTIPLGIIMTNSCIITVCSRETPVLSDFIFDKIRGFTLKKRKRFCCQILYKNCLVYQSLLKSIDRKRNEIELKINEDMKDADLVSLHYLEANLVYFATSLHANATVLERIRRYHGLSDFPEDEELLDDTIIENTQAIETTRIYQDIIKGTSELFSTVINNRLNNVMKFLASITIVMAIPTIIAGLWGMNVALPFGANPYGFAIVLALTGLICLVVILVLHRKKML